MRDVNVLSKDNMFDVKDKSSETGERSMSHAGLSYYNYGWSTYIVLCKSNESEMRQFRLLSLRTFALGKNSPFFVEKLRNSRISSD